MGVSIDSPARSVEEIATFASTMRLGQTTEFPYPSLKESLDEIKELIKSKTPLTTFSFEVKKDTIVISRYQTFPPQKESNFADNMDQIYWLASKMLPKEISTFMIKPSIGRGFLNMGERAQSILNAVWKPYGKVFSIYSATESDHHEITVKCFSN